MTTLQLLCPAFQAALIQLIQLAVRLRKPSLERLCLFMWCFR
jgi:hypothetical protein